MRSIHVGLRLMSFLPWSENVERVCVIYRWGDCTASLFCKFPQREQRKHLLILHC